jgi:hypothetical protein
MDVVLSAHNIRLEDGSLTKPEERFVREDHPWYKSAKRIQDTVFPGDESRLRLADLGCVEGGFSVEFARMGFRVPWNRGS